MALVGRSFSTIKVGNGTTVNIEYRDSLPSTSALAKECGELGKQIGMSIYLQHEDIFNAMHSV